MKLQYLVANAAWVFTFGSSITRMGDAEMFHATRKAAVAAAKRCGLLVARDGSVSAEPALAEKM
jgi:hypothetical protein